MSVVGKKKGSSVVDRRPFEQRVKEKRGARRMNHKFGHLYRHYKYEEEYEEDVVGYLNKYGGFECEFLVREMIPKFVKLKELSIERHVHPNCMFLKHTLNMRAEHHVHVPPQIFGARLEGSLAPKHAFLMLKGLPHGSQLWQEEAKPLQTLLSLCTNDKAFLSHYLPHTSQAHAQAQYQTLHAAFARGLMAAARNQYNYTCSALNITNAQIIDVLIRHGANPHETDIRGATLLHWAAGAGHVQAYETLLPYFHPNPAAERDGATPLHWAAAGVQSQNIGSGGHVQMCNTILQQSHYHPDVVNALTKDSNSVLMWAAWSGSLDICKLLIRHRANVHIQNRNGCTVAHWAASGGNLQLCQYLHTYTNVDFFQPNHAGNTPLSHAVAYQHTPIVQWLLQLNNNNDHHHLDKRQQAQDLAWDFVQWNHNDDAHDDHHTNNSNDIYNLFSTQLPLQQQQQQQQANEEENDWYLTSNT
jgi:ankyrin repeat protein